MFILLRLSAAGEIVQIEFLVRLRLLAGKEHVVRRLFGQVRIFISIAFLVVFGRLFVVREKRPIVTHTGNRLLIRGYYSTKLSKCGYSLLTIEILRFVVTSQFLTAGRVPCRIKNQKVGKNRVCKQIFPYRGIKK